MLALLVAAVMLAGAGYWYLAAHKDGQGKEVKPAGPVPVKVASAKTADIPVLLEVVGRAEAYESVTLKARVDGQVAAVSYAEGQHVRQGDVLLRLDPADFQARLQQAEANLARDEAQLAKARADVQRYVALNSRGFVSEEKVNEVRTAEAAAQATLRADQAAVELARLQVSYTTIRAPFAGVVGARLVFPGTAVKTNDTALAVVNRVRPLYVTFSVPEKHLPKLRAALARGPLHASISLPGNREQRSNDPRGNEPHFDAQIGFIDNAVDATTGTIQMKARLDNQDEKLTPGQFLNVAMALDTLNGAVVVPAEAVQQGPEGNFLYVVREDRSVEVRKIAVLATYRGLAAIAQGVADGETVVTDGQLRLKPGATVQVKSPAPETGKAPAPTPAAAPAAATK